jgi:hypothetical protein
VHIITTRYGYFRESPSRPPPSTLPVQLVSPHLPQPQICPSGIWRAHTGTDFLRRRSTTTLCDEGPGEERDCQAETGGTHQFRTSDLGEGPASFLGRIVSLAMWSRLRPVTGVVAKHGFVVRLGQIRNVSGSP